MKDEQIVILINNGRDKDGALMLQLWDRCRGLVARIVGKYPAPFRDDLTQEAYLAIYDAVYHYRADFGASFVTYAGYWMRQRIKRYYWRNNGIKKPYTLLDSVSRYNRVCSEYHMMFGADPADHELCALLECDRVELQRIRAAADPGAVLSLDAAIEGTDGSSVNLHDALADPADALAETEQRADRAKMKEALQKILSELPEEKRTVLCFRYLNGYSVKDVCQVLKKPYNRVRRMELNSLRELRRNTSDAGTVCREYTECYLPATPYKHRTLRSFYRTWTSQTEYEALRNV